MTGWGRCTSRGLALWWNSGNSWVSEPPLLVYFSSVSENTHRFVQKVQSAYPELEILRLPLKASEASEVRVERPFVLAFPTYGGGSGPDKRRYTPVQVIKFLNIEENRELCVGVSGLGNKNFGRTYCAGAYVVAEKLGVPVLTTAEIMGSVEETQEMVEKLREVWGGEG